MVAKKIHSINIPVQMLVSVHMLVCAFKDLSSPSWVNDVKLITAQAVEAILDASEYLDSNHHPEFAP